MKKNKVFLIDGNSYCYRAYYAIKELKNSKGLPTNAVYGFLLMLKKLLALEDPDYIGVAFDLKGPTFRHKRFEGYKIKRKPMPDDLVGQMPLIKDLVSAYGIPIFEKEGYEADDILATVAKRASKEGMDVYIVTGDKDALQLVDEHIMVYNLHKEGLLYDKEAVKKRLSGLGPESVVDLMALAGDPTDNIPGVRGIGEKTALDLIKEFGDLDNLYRNLDKLKSPSKRRMLEDGEADARMSRELAKVDSSVSIEIDVESMRIRQPDTQRLFAIFKEMDFKAFAKELASADSRIKHEACYKTVVDQDEFDDLIRELKKQKAFVLDFETTSENPLRARPLGVSFCWKKGEACYVSFIDDAGNGRVKSGKKGIKIEYAFDRLRPVLEDEKIQKIGQNVKYERLILLKQGIDLRGVSFDTMVASYLLNPSKFNHNLDDMALEHLNHRMISIEELLGSGKNKITMDMVPLDKISAYSCEDSDVTLRLKEVFEKQLFEKELDRLFRDIELPLIDVLSEIEKNGIKIDTVLLKKISMDIGRELSGIIEDIYKIDRKSVV